MTKTYGYILGWSFFDPDPFMILDFFGILFWSMILYLILDPNRAPGFDPGDPFFYDPFFILFYEFLY